MLISTAELRAHLNDPTWIVFDCRHDLMTPARGAALYRENHIPGACFAPVDTALSGTKNGRNGRHPLPLPEAFAAFLGQQGVTAATQLVAYDDAGGQYSARFWWMARWIGLERVAVLDGGLAKWLADGFPVTTEVPQSRAGGGFTVKLNAGQLANVDEVATRSKSGSGLVIDARTPERFRGEVEPVDPVAGRIPGAKNRPFKTNLNANLTMRPAAELRLEFESLIDGREPSEVIHQCGSGITACANLLAMEHAGLKGSKLYAGSWSEWIADPSRAIARG
ncbi:MAG: sulfurtransferase [Verrucomicrobia bacterium]|nr:sulfurtransferase [Verrucomicrobiota bacterium]